MPAGYVRWTEQRNLQAFVDLVASGKVDPAPLTTQRFPVQRAAEAYALLTNPDPQDRPFGILLEYEADSVGSARRVRGTPTRRPHRAGSMRIGVSSASAPSRGPLEDDHWLHDPEEGGGRLLGEGCHFVDLVSDLVGSRIVSAHAVAVPQPQRPLECSDAFTVVLRCADGSVGSVVYSGGGDPRLPKERIEAFGGSVSAVLDDYRRLELYAGAKRKVIKSHQDKGHRRQMLHFVIAVRGEVAAPSASSYIDSTHATLALAESLRTGMPVNLPSTGGD